MRNKFGIRKQNDDLSDRKGKLEKKSLKQHDTFKEKMHTIMKLLYSATLYQYEEKSSIIELRFILFYLFFKFYLFLAALGLRCCARAFSSCSEWGLLFVAVHGLLIAVASLVAEHGP